MENVSFTFLETETAQKVKTFAESIGITVISMGSPQQSPEISGYMEEAGHVPIPEDWTLSEWFFMEIELDDFWESYYISRDGADYQIIASEQSASTYSGISSRITVVKKLQAPQPNRRGLSPTRRQNPAEYGRPPRRVMEEIATQLMQQEATTELARRRQTIEQLTAEYQATNADEYDTANETQFRMPSATNGETETVGWTTETAQDTMIINPHPQDAGKTPEQISTEMYELALKKMGEHDMTLTEQDITFASPLNAFNIPKQTFATWLMDEFKDLPRKINIRALAANPYLSISPKLDTLELLFLSTPDINATRTVSGSNSRYFLGLDSAALSSTTGYSPAPILFFNECVNIEDPATGTVIAQLFNQKHLYFLFHLTQNNSMEELTVIKFIIQTAISKMSSIPSVIRNKYGAMAGNIKTEIEKQKQEKLRARITDMFINNLNRKIAQTKDSITRNTEAIKGFFQDIIELYKQIEANKAALKGLEISRIEKSKTIDPMQIFNHKKIAKIEIDENSGIALTTVPLFFTIPDNQLVFELGEMRIIVRIGERALPSIFNKTRQLNAYSDGMHHPHIFADGEPCWGNIAEPITKVYENANLNAYLDLIIAYCETVNMRDSAGEYAYIWPLAAKKYQKRDDYAQTYENAIKHLDYTAGQELDEEERDD